MCVIVQVHHRMRNIIKKYGSPGKNRKWGARFYPKDIALLEKEGLVELKGTTSDREYELLQRGAERITHLQVSVLSSFVFSEDFRSLSMLLRHSTVNPLTMKFNRSA